MARRKKSKKRRGRGSVKVRGYVARRHGKLVRVRGYTRRKPRKR